MKRKLTSEDETKTKTKTKNINIGYVTSPIEKRLLLLFTLLKKNRNKKLIVIFNSISSAKYHHELFNHLDLNTTLIVENNKQTNQKINKIISNLNDNNSSGINILINKEFIIENKTYDLSNCDQLILYEPINPIELEVLFGNFNKFLVILQMGEEGFLGYLKSTVSVEAENMKFTWSKITDIQLQIEKLVSESYFLNTSAKEAFKSYLKSYNNLELKDIFCIKNLVLKKLCLAFGFKVPIAVDLTDEPSNSRIKKNGSDGYGYYKDGLNATKVSEYRQIENARKINVFKVVKNKKKRFVKRLNK